jgi:aminoglycoside phosphotransferase (APT) family kinase protein
MASAAAVVPPPSAAALEHHLDGLGLGAGPVAIARIGDGHSNLSYRLRRDGADVVLRRPPHGELAPSTHDVLREARIQRAVEGEVPVPRVVATCEDPAVIGAPFYLMDFVEGAVLVEAVPPALDSAAALEAVADTFADGLVALHEVDWRAAGLGDLARSTGYGERQVRRFTGLWEHNRTRVLPDLDRVTAWLGAHVPAYAEATIVHGDYRLGNVMYTGEPVAVAAVLDWELCTLGDPLADVGYMLATFPQAGEDSLFKAFNPACRHPGFPRRERVQERYLDRSGRDPSSLLWYMVLGLWKSAVFLEGSYKRHLAGLTDDAFFAELEWGVPDLAARALTLTRGGGLG